jgi:hypothetical protein
MAKAWTNPDGLQVKFANYWNDKTNFVNRPRATSMRGMVKQLVIDYDLVVPAGVQYTADLNNDGTADGFDLMDTYLPAYASVLRTVLYVTEAAAGGTSISLGTFQKAGTAISATSLITATEGAIANLDTLGARTIGAGTLNAVANETASVGANDAYVGLTVTGTFTAGKGKIIIEYIDPLGDAP